MYIKFFHAIWDLAGPLEEYIRALPRRPVCLVADASSPWTAPVCGRLGIPRLVMHFPSAYFQLAVHCLTTYGVYDRVDEMEPFVVPGFPVRAVGSKATIRGFFQYPGVEKEQQDVLDAEATADGLVFNTFRGIEGTFLDAYAAALGKKTWSVGPTCASSSMVDDVESKAGRGKPADVDAEHIVSWLDARAPASLAELARGLEASRRPFVWAIKEAKTDAAVRALLDDEGFEARVQDRALRARVGAAEALSLGVPALTWPTMADQFCSEKLLVDVLKVGVRSGVKIPAMYVHLPKKAEGVQVTSGDVEKAIAELMGDEPEAAARRTKAKEIATEARTAMQEGGSSHSDLTDLISYVSELSRKRGHENSTVLPSAVAKL
ncbi:hypothetical protein QYE76_050532 [Lolium multiflorum]|uniref:Uncharacterized protein n=1 Tax=Lolium multiflorum TaxID=4521 RepID=A0AAD8SS25_LOLMU|nr:hypothetical protein QYE76_050532 [Lolium multiflorum]